MIIVLFGLSMITIAISVGSIFIKVVASYLDGSMDGFSGRLWAIWGYWVFIVICGCSKIVFRWEIGWVCL